jgi:hypothetical protein
LSRVVRAGIRLFRLPRDVMSGLVSILLVGRILGSLLWILCTFPVVRRAAVWRFSRRLRRSGLDEETRDTLIDDYDRGLTLFGCHGSEEDSGHE